MVQEDRATAPKNVLRFSLWDVPISVSFICQDVPISEILTHLKMYRLMGSSSAPSVSDHAHKDLSVQAEQLSQLVGDYGTICERLLITHRKNIISELKFEKKFHWSSHNFFTCVDEQFILQRLANAAIDIYGMAAVISRYVYT